MWGGRFSDKPAELMQAINVSIGFDRRLAAQDLEGSRAHAAMLQKTGVITSDDAQAILKGLDAIGQEMAAGTFPFRDEFEDIHMNVEARLRELIGPAAGRLHTARSRNDQVALDFRMWVREACDRTAAQLKALQRALVAKAEPHAATPDARLHPPAARPAGDLRPSSDGYVEMFGRDASRFADARARMNESPLGAAALAGSPFPHRPARDRDGPGLRPALRKLPGRRRRPRFRPGGPGRGDHRRDPPLAPGRGDRHLDDAAVRLHQAHRRLHHRLVDHAAEEEPRRRRAGARQGRSPAGLLHPARRGDEGPAADLFEGHAGGQGPHLRGLRRPGALPARPWPAWSPTWSPTPSAWPPRPAPASPPPPTSPTGWSASSACRSATPITSPAPP